MHEHVMGVAYVRDSAYPAFLILSLVQVQYADLQREKLKEVIGEMAEKNKQIEKFKIKDKEKIKQLEGLLQKFQQQIEILVNVKNCTHRAHK